MQDILDRLEPLPENDFVRFPDRLRTADTRWEAERFLREFSEKFPAADISGISRDLDSIRFAYYFDRKDFLAKYPDAGTNFLP